MKLSTVALVVALGLCPFVSDARQEGRECGTHAATEQQEAFLHQQSMRQPRIAAALKRRSVNLTPRPDQGNIAVLDGVDGVVSRRNPFTLQNRTITFLPNGSGYDFITSGSSYDPTAATASSKVEGLGDDDSRYIDLPFLFPFYGARYRQLAVNSDGNLTFGISDSASTDRSLGRLTSGPPRIAPLLRDLDPSKSTDGVRVNSTPQRVVISWSGVPEFSDGPAPNILTFQVRLYPDGKIEFSYTAVATDSAVVGISPGLLNFPATLLSFATAGRSSTPLSGAIAELFANQQEVDIVIAAQNFYGSHDDAYDYLVLYNTMSVAPCPPGAVACENTVQRLMNQTGYGDDRTSSLVAAFGSHRRLQAVLNMGSLDQYPNDPNAIATVSANPYNTPIKILGHEAGHLWLSYASVRDTTAPAGTLAETPMLGRSSVHWAFTFNSEASLLEGNRIQDFGAGTSGRFVTSAAAEGYSPLDQYLMGFRPPEEVPPTFYVANSAQSQSQAPRLGVSMSGTRRDVTVQDIIAQHGRRTPDSTVSQRHFRFAFVLVVAPGTTPTAAQIAKLDAFRSSFEVAFPQYAGNRSTADTSLQRSVGLSLFPASGIAAGQSGTGTFTLESPAPAPLTIALKASQGIAQVPAGIVIPAGARQASFTITGMKPGVEEVTAVPADSAYETAFARVQVVDALASLRLVGANTATIPGIVELRVTDVNNLPYPGVSVSARVSGGIATPPSAVSDETGTVRFNWLPSTTGAQSLTASLASAPSVSTTVVAAPSVITPNVISGVVNAASFTAGAAPGSLATLFGTGLASATQVTLNGRPVPISFNNDTQVNFLVPADTPLGVLNVAVTNDLGTTPVFPLTLYSVQPGVFYDTATGYGAILVKGILNQKQAAATGDVLEVYATGFGPLATSARNLQETTGTVQATVGSQPAVVLYSGAAPGFTGLYQVNVQLPAGLTAGPHDLVLTINGVKSNAVKVLVK